MVVSTTDIQSTLHPQSIPSLIGVTLPNTLYLTDPPYTFKHETPHSNYMNPIGRTTFQHLTRELVCHPERPHKT